MTKYFNLRSVVDWDSCFLRRSTSRFKFFTCEATFSDESSRSTVLFVHCFVEDVPPLDKMTSLI